MRKEGKNKVHSLRRRGVSDFGLSLGCLLLVLAAFAWVAQVVVFGDYGTPYT